MYDDSDGWYDHQMGPIVNTSTGPADGLYWTWRLRDGSHALARVESQLRRTLWDVAVMDHGCRCLSSLPGRSATSWITPLPIRRSIIRFVEDNWLGGNAHWQRFVRRNRQLDHPDVQLQQRGGTVAVLFLNPSTGESGIATTHSAGVFQK